MQMHHLHAKNEVYSPTYNEWLDIMALCTSPTMEANDVTMHVLAYSPYEDPKYLLLLVIWPSLYDPKYFEVFNPIVNSPMSLKNVA